MMKYFFFNFLKAKVKKLEKFRILLRPCCRVAYSKLAGIDEVELEIFAKQVLNLPIAV